MIAVLHNPTHADHRKRPDFPFVAWFFLPSRNIRQSETRLGLYGCTG
jgi:hypothetical protein